MFTTIQTPETHKNKIDLTSEFNFCYKYKLSEAPDFICRCIVNEETQVIEVIANHFDSKIFLQMALKEFPARRIEAIQEVGLTPADLLWKIYFLMGNIRFKIQIVEMITPGRCGSDDYTVLISEPHES